MNDCIFCKIINHQVPSYIISENDNVIKMKSKKNKISYEAEADVLSWEISDKDIDSAKEVGNLVIHFSKNNTPVLVEILGASEFLKTAKKLVAKKEGVTTLALR